MNSTAFDVATRARLGEVCRQYGVARLLMFGSAARGAAQADSDLDVLYELLPGKHLGWEVEDLADELSDVLGRRVDLVSAVALHRRLRPGVLGDAREFYAA
ncbi:MAG: nucleotidyltransferase family protein [Phycicoccus sp.]